MVKIFPFMPVYSLPHTHITQSDGVCLWVFTYIHILSCLFIFMNITLHECARIHMWIVLQTHPHFPNCHLWPCMLLLPNIYLLKRWRNRKIVNIRARLKGKNVQSVSRYMSSLTHTVVNVIKTNLCFSKFFSLVKKHGS